MNASHLKFLTQASALPEIERLAGNKGKSLYRLGNRGVPVPHWAVLGADWFAAFRRDGGLDRRIAALLDGFTPERAGPISRAIADAILASGLSPAMCVAIAGARAYIGDGPIAVRSSGVEEDGADFSFAGQFDTYLDVRGLASTIEHVRRCWASAYSERSLRYRHQHGLDVAATEMAVILQRLVPADKSGVVFTVNPANGSPDEIVVSSVYGLGEGLVSGAVDADTIIVDRQTGKAKQVVIGEKLERHDGRAVREVPPELREKLSVDDGELERIVATARTLEAALGRPQDIEWCIAGGELWILQARPVTTPVARPAGDFQLWDNSNIVENYPGVTTQLTFTFAQHVYSQVFREFCRLLGIPRKQRREMDGFLGGVLGFLNGRVYYNLLHWYKLSGLAPLQDLGRKMMEVQMGVGEPLDLASFAARIAPFTVGSRAEHAYIRAVTGAKFAWYFATLERNVAAFREFFYGVYDKFDALDYGSMPADEVYRHYLQFEQELLSRWGMMIALESAIGLSYGLVRRLIKRWMPGAPDWFEVAVIGGIDGVESVAPVHRLAALAEAVRARPHLEQLVRQSPSSEAYAALRRSGEPEVMAEIERYIADFAYRSKNELKLEEPDLREDPSVLFDMLKASLANGARPLDRAATEERVAELAARPSEPRPALDLRAGARPRAQCDTGPGDGALLPFAGVWRGAQDVPGDRRGPRGAGRARSGPRRRPSPPGGAPRLLRGHGLASGAPPARRAAQARPRGLSRDGGPAPALCHARAGRRLALEAGEHRSAARGVRHARRRGAARNPVLSGPRGGSRAGRERSDRIRRRHPRHVPHRPGLGAGVRLGAGAAHRTRQPAHACGDRRARDRHSDDRPDPRPHQASEDRNAPQGRRPQRPDRAAGGGLT